MRNFSFKPYLWVALLLFLPLACPPSWVNSWRYMVVASFALPWKKLQKQEEKKRKAHPSPNYSEHSQLVRENELLKKELRFLKEWIGFNEHTSRQIEVLRVLAGKQEQDEDLKEYFKRRAEDMARIVEMSVHAVEAEVTFREPTTWNNTFWINVGERQNELLDQPQIGINSPVVIGNNIIGVIDYVGKKHSRVRLITDNRLLCAVRAVRGAEEDLLVLDKVEGLLSALELRKGKAGFSHLEETVAYLKKLKADLVKSDRSFFLAKGEVKGIGAPLWRTQKSLLKGVGFNYDFADAEGPARHLITGLPIGEMNKEAMQILKEGDVLVTSGLDGIFPKGLRVGIVSKVNLPREGACSYEIEVVPAVENLNEITEVQVLHPLEFSGDFFNAASKP